MLDSFFFHLVRKSIQNERNPLVLRAWIAVATDISESFRDDVDVIPNYKAGKLVAIMNCLTNSVKAIPPEECTKKGSIERNKECTNVYDLFFENYETIVTHDYISEFIGRMDKKNNRALEYIMQVKMKEDDPLYKIAMMKLAIRDAFCSSEYRTDPVNLFVPSMDVTRFLPQVDIPSLSVQLYADYDNYIEFCNTFVNQALEYVEYEVEKIEAHYDCVSVSVVEEQPLIDIEDNTSIIEEMKEIVEQLEMKDSIQMTDIKTMDLKKNNRPLEPAKSKMKEILQEVPELNGKKTYCEISAGHLGFLEEYAQQNEGVLLEVFVTMNTLDPSFTKDVKALSPDYKPMVNVRKKVCFTDFDFDAKGSLGVLKKIAPDKKSEFLVWDVSVVMDSRYRSETLSSVVLGVDKVKDNYQDYKKMGRTMSKRLIQVQMLMPHYLRVGGQLLIKCQHLLYNSSLFSLLSLSACFEKSRLVRLKSSKDTGTEFYFVGLNYQGAPIKNTYEVKSLVSYIKGIYFESLNNFRLALDEYQLKLERKQNDTHYKIRGERFKKMIGKT